MWSDMTVVELKARLRGRGLPVSGAKAVLIRRLEESGPPLPPSGPPPNRTSRYFAGGRRMPSTPSTAGESPAPATPTKPPAGRKGAPCVTPERSGGAAGTPAKRKSPAGGKPASPRRRRTRAEPGSLDPPEGWERTYALVEELRSDRSAPVDADGGEELPERHLGPAVRRFQILIALMLSSQTKDGVVGETMRGLQKHGLTVESINDTDPDTLNKLIGKVGFHNNKTKYIKQSAEILISKYNGDIPPTADAMMELPGIGPKMAYIIENVAFNTVSGIGVDTHMHRIFNDLKWVDSTTPEQTREQLEGWLPKDRWGEVNVLWVGFGQETQQQKEKMLRKALACSSPTEALKLIQMVRLDVKKEAKRFSLEEELRDAMDE